MNHTPEQIEKLVDEFSLYERNSKWGEVVRAAYKSGFYKSQELVAEEIQAMKAEIERLAEEKQTMMIEQQSQFDLDGAEIAKLREDKARLIEALKMARECVRFKLWKREEYLFDQLLTEMEKK